MAEKKMIRNTGSFSAGDHDDIHNKTDNISPTKGRRAMSSQKRLVVFLAITLLFVQGLRAQQDSSAERDAQNATAGIDKPPQLVASVLPVYPQTALKDSLEGRVMVEVNIDTSGAVKEAVVRESSNKVFDQPSIDAAMKYRFTPAVRDNKRIAVWVMIPFSYRVKAK